MQHFEMKLKGIDTKGSATIHIESTEGEHTADPMQSEIDGKQLINFLREHLPARTFEAVARHLHG